MGRQGGGAARTGTQYRACGQAPAGSPGQARGGGGRDPQGEISKTPGTQDIAASVTGWPPPARTTVTFFPVCFSFQAPGVLGWPPRFPREGRALPAPASGRRGFYDSGKEGTDWGRPSKY